MLAIESMDPSVQFLFYLAAIICLVLASLGATFRLALGWLGLALFVVPFAWEALVRA